MAIRKKITKSRFCRPQLTILNILRQDFFNTRCYEIFYMMDILSCLLATRTASLERNHLTVSVWRICRQLKESTKGDIHYYYGQQFPRAFSPANVDQLPPPFWLLPSACQLPLSSLFFRSGAFCQGDLSPLSAWHSLIFDWAKKANSRKMLRGSGVCCRWFY